MTINLFIPLTKADESAHEVWGLAAVEEPDLQREILDYEMSKPNFIAWSERVRQATGGKSKGNVRTLHKGGMSAVGKLIHFEPLDDKKAFFVGAKIVDEEAWQKIVEGVYTGFSVGGGYGRRMPDKLLKGYIRYEALPSEISLVDLPAAPNARFEMVKADGASELRKFAHELAKGESLDDMVNQVRAAFQKQCCAMPGTEASMNDGWVIDVQTDQVIVDKGQQGLFAYPYERDDAGAVVFGQPAAVERKYMLKKGATEAALARLQALIDEMKASDNPDVKAYGEKIQAANDAEEASEVTEEAAESETDQTVNAGEKKPGAVAEAGAAPGGQGLSADAVKEIVVNLLTDLGLVQREGDAAQKADFTGELRKSLNSYGSMLGTYETALKGLEAKVAPIEDLQKSVSGVSERQATLIGDLAKVASAAEDLHARLESLEKRGGMGPVLREIPSASPEEALINQQVEALAKMAESTPDPLSRQLIQNEVARLKIKVSQNKPINQ